MAIRVGAEVDTDEAFPDDMVLTSDLDAIVELAFKVAVGEDQGERFEALKGSI